MRSIRRYLIRYRVTSKADCTLKTCCNVTLCGSYNYFVEQLISITFGTSHIVLDKSDLTLVCVKKRILADNVSTKSSEVDREDAYIYGEKCVRQYIGKYMITLRNGILSVEIKCE